MKPAVQKRKPRLGFDPRTKLVMLALLSVVILFDNIDGPAYWLRTILTFIPVLLVSLAGKPQIGVRFLLLFLLATWMTGFSQRQIGGWWGMMILFLCYAVTQFAPTIMAVWYCFATTQISELLAALGRMHVPQGLGIAIAVMMRFFPTLAEEYRSIRDAMRMRGIGFGGGKPSKMLEYRLIPLLFSCVSIGDELSAAAVTRGLGAPVKRTYVCEIGFHVQDAVLLVSMSLLTASYLYFALGGTI